MTRRSRRAFIVQKGYGKKKAIAYYPLDESEDINLEPLTLRRIMKQVQVELLKPLEFCGHFSRKTYPVGVHSLDSDLAKLLVRVRSARYVLPHKEVLAAKQGGRQQ
jgi:hypothetical protein